MKLTLDLIPQSSFFINVRSEVSQSDWNKIRRIVYARTKNMCAICGGVGGGSRVECHEVFEYNEETRIQKLVYLMALCSACHRVKHYGYWKLQGHEDLVFKHLMDINGISSKEAQVVVDEAFREWELRSKIIWKLDLSLLKTEFGIQLKEGIK
jgi:hypothetical protein